ncbi:hypothetical protein Syun_018596 [Stephania yunnanensis]|uniref:Uncharacterized protein n=1 Tax=Stephania yunnanensis TaxID=152371 RepID=A0AAP0ISN6_9MAGN
MEMKKVKVMEMKKVKVKEMRKVRVKRKKKRKTKKKKKKMYSSKRSEKWQVLRAMVARPRLQHQAINSRNDSHRTPCSQGSGADIVTSRGKWGASLNFDVVLSLELHDVPNPLIQAKLDKGLNGIANRLIVILAVGDTKLADGELVNVAKLDMFVDKLPGMPKIYGFEMKNGVHVSKSLKIGMFMKRWDYLTTSFVDSTDESQGHEKLFIDIFVKRFTKNLMHAKIGSGYHNELSELLKYWPNIKCPSSEGKYLWRNTWNAYGVCFGLSEHDYFNKALELREKIDLLPIFNKNGGHYKTNS